MRTQQVLALCMLACLACSALAYEKEEYGEEYEKKNYEEKEPYKGYGEKLYPPHEPTCDDDDDCGPDSFPELKGPTCLKPSGKCVEYDEAKCKTSGKPKWCKQINKKWACEYDFKPNGVTCREKDGLCDKEDKCTGDSAKCDDKVADKDTVCKDWKEGPCVETSKCDGKKKRCPGKKYAPHGTPCADGSLYEEAYDESGKVYAMAEGENTEAETLARKYKWAKCSKRCYEGECGSWKKQWWKKEVKDKKYHDDKEDYPEGKYYNGEEEKKEAYEKKSEKKEKHDEDKEYYEVKNDEYYATKHSYSDADYKGEEHEGNYYCKKGHSSY